MHLKNIFFIALIVVSAHAEKSAAQQTIRYDLFVRDTMVRYNGKSAMAVAINGQIPGPTLTFTEGDTAVIYVHNMMDMETSIHWHGIILPNNQDGVPYLTNVPIRAHTTYRYKFPLVQSGTYWYHSHTGFQEQTGLYGAFIIYKKNEAPMAEYPLLLSDWTSEMPMEVLRSLKFANDWYAIEKHSTQNYGAALVHGYLGAKLKQEWLRMYPMDVSDVYYNAFLVNGKTEQSLHGLKAGDKIKLRIVNGSSSTYFWLQFAGSKLTVVASDGEDVRPVEVDRMIIGPAETYDVIVTVPQDRSYEFKATSEDRSNCTSLWLGNGMKMPAPVLAPLNYFEGMKMMNSMMHFNGSMSNMGMQMSHQQMDMNTVMYPEIPGEGKPKNKKHGHSKTDTLKMEDDMQMNMADMGGNIVTLNYGMLRAVKKTTLPAAPMQVLYFNLTGNMNRYVWSINNKVLSDADKILIKRGENVRIILNNQTMMRHPMHLHGHYFRLLNGQGDYAPLKNVIDIMPMETDTIEFAAQYDGDWFFHCHILYHMMSGMGRIFSYENSPPNVEVDTIKHSWKKFLKGDKMWYFSTYIAAQSNGLFPDATLMNLHYVFDEVGMVNYQGYYESETHFGRLFGKRQFFKLYVGSDIRMLNANQNLPSDSKQYSVDNRKAATAGIQYLFPFFIQGDLRIDQTGHVRFEVSRNDLAPTSRLRLDVMWNTDNEYHIDMRYILVKRLSLSANYDSHFGLGGGITFTY